jgi:hypothetical protein
MSTKNKRDIFRFNGEKPTAINLEHVTSIAIEGKRLTFSFYTSSIFVDLENDDVAKTCFEQLLNVWAAYGTNEPVTEKTSCLPDRVGADPLERLGL